MSEGTPMADASAPAEAAVANENSTPESTESSEKAKAKEVKQTPEELWEEFELKVNGKTKKEKINLKNKDELRNKLQLAAAAQEALAEKSKLTKDQQALEAEIQEFFKLLKSNPKEVLRDPTIGLDIKRFAEEVLNEELEKAAKDPKELELEEARKELERIKKEQEEMKKQQETREYELMVEQHAQKIETDIMTSLSKASLPESPILVKRVADYMSVALANDIDLQVHDVIPIVQKDIQTDIKELMKVMKPEQVKALFGDVIDMFRKEDIKKIKDVNNLAKVKDTGGAIEKAPAEEPKMSIKQWLNRKTTA